MEVNGGKNSKRTIIISCVVPRICSCKYSCMTETESGHWI